MPLKIAANWPLSSILFAMPPALSCKIWNKPLDFWSLLFLASIFLRTASCEFNSASSAANNSCCSIVSLPANISLFWAILALLKAILSDSLAISFWVNCPLDNFADKFIRFSVDLTADLRSATNPLCTVLPTISTAPPRSPALSTAVSKDVTNLSPMLVIASRINPISWFIPFTSSLAFPSPMGIK